MATTIEFLARRYGVLPTAVAEAGADYMIRHISILKAAGLLGDDDA